MGGGGGGIDDCYLVWWVEISVGDTLAIVSNVVINILALKHLKTKTKNLGENAKKMNTANTVSVQVQYFTCRCIYYVLCRTACSYQAVMYGFILLKKSAKRQN